MVLATISNWPIDDFKDCSINDSDCAEWVKFSSHGQDEANIIINDVFAKLDKYIDNKDGPLNGKIRKIDWGSIVQEIYFQGFPRVNKINPSGECV